MGHSGLCTVAVEGEAVGDRCRIEHRGEEAQDASQQEEGACAQKPLRRILLSATALAAPAAAGVSVLQDALSELQAQLDELVASESRGQRSGRPCLALPELSVSAP
jgi:hypothetical protein